MDEIKCSRRVQEKKLTTKNRKSAFLAGSFHIERNKDMDNTGETGLLFNIQRLSTHDGPGIRNLVFLKGCPLRCLWCSNPESQHPRPELATRLSRCLGADDCGLCLQACKPGAMRRRNDGRIEIDRKTCDNCGQCAQVCPADALTLHGTRYSVDEVVDKVEEDSFFFNRSGGGITVSGGDPILQAPFVEKLLRKCQERGIHTAVETTGFGSWEKLEKILKFADFVLYDIKCMDEEKHCKFTGVSNRLVLENLRKIPGRFPQTPIRVRTPVISGFNDTEEEIASIAEFASGLKTLESYELNPYHEFGASKYEQLGRKYSFENSIPPVKEKMDALKLVVKRKTGKKTTSPE